MDEIDAELDAEDTSLLMLLKVETGNRQRSRMFQDLVSLCIVKQAHLTDISDEVMTELGVRYSEPDMVLMTHFWRMTWKGRGQGR
jgi:hypothetical protein